MRRLLYFSLTAMLVCCTILSCSKNCIHHSPKADFTYKVMNPGMLPANVNFTAIASHTTSYEWQFGDGTKFQVTKDTISHIYTAAGTYIVQLVAIGISGSDTARHNIVITAN
jgi:PKD repeat protein